MSEIVNFLLEYLRQLTVVSFLVFAAISLLRSAPNGKTKSLDYILNSALSGSTIPTGLALLVCAIQPELLTKIGDASLNIAVAGIAILYIAIKGALFHDK